MSSWSPGEKNLRAMRLTSDSSNSLSLRYIGLVARGRLASFAILLSIDNLIPLSWCFGLWVVGGPSARNR